MSRAIFRAVAGAVRNVAHAHPKWNIHPMAASSIAKRATGTLVAMSPQALAATAPSDRHVVTRRTRRRVTGGRPDTGRLPAFSARMHREVSRLVRPAKDAGDIVRVETLIEVLRLIDQLRRIAELEAFVREIEDIETTWVAGTIGHYEAMVQVSDAWHRIRSKQQ